MNTYVKLSVSALLLLGSGVNNAYGMNFSMVEKYIEEKNNNQQVDIIKTAVLKADTDSVAFSPDGNYFAFTSYDRIVIRDLKSGQVQELAKHTDRINSIAFSNDSNYIASGSDDNRVIIWDIRSGEPLYRSKFHSMIFAVAFSPDDKYLVHAAYPSAVQIWDVIKDAKSKKTIHLKEHNYLTTKHNYLEAESNFQTLNEIHSIAFSPDGKYLVYGTGIKQGGIVSVCDVESGKEICQLEGHRNQVLSIAFSPDGKHLATGSYDNKVNIWNIESRELIFQLEQHTNGIKSLAFSPDGRYLASGSYDKRVIVWDAKSGKPIRQIKDHNCTVNSVAFSPDGKHVVSGSRQEDKKVVIYQIKEHANFMIDALKDEKNEKIEPLIKKHINSEDKNSKLNINYHSDHKRKFDELDN